MTSESPLSDDAVALPFSRAEAIEELKRRYPRAFDGTDPLTDTSLKVENARDWVLAAVLALQAIEGEG